MLIYALIYWSIILLLGIFFSLKVLNKFYKLIIRICRKWIITRIIIAFPLRMVVNTIASTGVGIIIFFHVVFFACIVGFIYGMFAGRSKFIVAMIAYTCISSLLLPIIFMFFKTLVDEVRDFKDGRKV